MKSALLKDTIKEIKNTYKRFLSILVMAFLGVGFFAGMRAASPDMVDTIDQYYKESQVYDIKILSTLGLTNDDIDALSEIDEIENTVGTYETEGKIEIDNKEIITKIFKNSELKNVLEKMLDEIKAGHQIYVVAPLIDDEEDEKMNVTSLKDKFDVAFNGMVPTGLLHGKMKPNQKDEVMNSFKNGDTKILISTTVIEVGVDVKNATMMVIFNAERFGLATLHQLRGRVGRNDMQSYCYLISDYDAERLKVLEESNDGFYISEQDFKLRGGGDIFGVRQSGEQSFKIANLNRDYKILMQCKSDAEEFLKSKNLDDYKDQKEILENLTIA